MIGQRTPFTSAFTLLLVVLLLIMIIGQLFGQPIVLGFVATGSMSPALEAGDGFVAVPPAIHGEISEGDVITFDAREIEGGGLTTHRVGAVTDEGYVTVGDANPFTDQDGGEPLVQDHQVKAVALQLDGWLVRIPYIGTISLWLQGLLLTMFGLLGAIPLFGSITEGDIGGIMVGTGLVLLIYVILADFSGEGRRSKDRSRKREGAMSSLGILLIIILLITLPATASMVLPSGVNEQQIISSSSPAEDPFIIQSGQSSDVNYQVESSGFFPRVIIIEPASSGVEMTEEVLYVSRGQTAETTATIFAPPETGTYQRAISERQYIGFLPTSLIVSLHNVHPWFAIAAINGVIILVVSIVYILAIGLHPFRMRSTERNVTWVQKTKRVIRRYK